MATLKDIAQVVGVSNGTVSRVLNYDMTLSVSEEKRMEIFKVAQQLGYKKKVINPTIDQVAILYWADEQEELEETYYQYILTELMSQAKERNINLVSYKKQDGLRAIDKKINAFIGIGWFDRTELDYLLGITTNGIFIDSSPDDKYFDSIRPNHDSIVTQIVDYFMLKGHKSIGFIGGTDRNIDTLKPSMDVREWSFRESAAYYQVLDERHIFIADSLTVAQGYRLGQKIISELGDELPTAFCVGSDTLTIGVLQAFLEARIDVPARVAFFSIHNLKVSQYVSPPLTTFHIDVPIMCESALDLLQERMIKGRTITKSVFINGTPVFRKSC
ncbi:MAG: LacI family DNA-binding transcriptional regulator [Turicibacter sp.]